MTGFSRTGCLAFLLLAIGFPTPTTAEEGFPQSVSVTKTFDGRPFEYQILDRTPRTGHVVYRLRFPSPMTTGVPQNNTVPAEYYVPEGMKPDDPKRPAVICLHILDGNMELVRLTCSVLASHGIPSILFMLPYYGDRALPEGPEALARDPKLFVGAIDQALVDVKRTVDVLASRPEIDPEHIGITGVSLGGIVAATAARFDPRLSRAVLILAGGDLRTIIHHARETRDLSQLINRLPAEEKAEVERAIDGVDPLRDADRLRGRAATGKVLMVNAADDEVIPPECSRKLAAALGIDDRVVWLDGLGHYTALSELPRIMQLTADFFAQDLPEGLRRNPAGQRPRTPLQVVVSVVQQMMGFLVSEPSAGRCHFVDLAIEVVPRNERTYEGRLLLVRGAAYRFKLQAKAPVIGELAVGQGDYPWMASLEKTLFKGGQGEAAGPGNPLAYADPNHLMKLRMAAGAIAGLGLAPDLLEQLVTIREETLADGRKEIRLDLKEGVKGTLWLALREDQKTPERITFDVAGVQGKVQVQSWLIDTVAHKAVFQPPPGLTGKEVPRDALYRVFSAMYNLAMEYVE